MDNIGGNLAIYTCFYGSDTNPTYRVPVIPSEKYHYYYYTNNPSIVEKLKGTPWTVVFEDVPTTDDLNQSGMLSKRAKAVPHRYKELQDYDYTCYMDSKLPELSIDWRL